MDPDKIVDFKDRGEYPKYFDFGHALHLVRNGKRVTRTFWGSKDKFIFLVQGSVFTVNREPLLSFYKEGTPISYHPHIYMQTSPQNICVWSPTQVDILAQDWELHAE